MPTHGERLRLAAGLFAAPGEDALAILAGVAALHPQLDAARRELAALGPEEWAAEHGRLFINGHPRTPCLPFESAQVNGIMPGPATAEVAALYAALGLEAGEAPADYLGSMLECAAWLADEEADAAAERALWQRLRRWLPGYAETLAGESRLLLYRFLAGELAAVCREAPDV